MFDTMLSNEPLPFSADPLVHLDPWRWRYVMYPDPDGMYIDLRYYLWEDLMRCPDSMSA